MSDRPSRRKFDGAITSGAVMSLGLTSPKGLATTNQNSTQSGSLKSMAAFTISAQRGIPDKASIRTQDTSRNRLESLMRKPDHKTSALKFDPAVHTRSIAPLTSEDIN